MWIATVDWGQGVKEELGRDEDFWPLLVQLGNMPMDTTVRVKKSRGKAIISLSHLFEAGYAYRDQVPRSGKYRDVVLDTIHKAKGYVEWQYEQGLITQQEQENALQIIEVEFAGM